jgi:hypothetical protein
LIPYKPQLENKTANINLLQQQQVVVTVGLGTANKVFDQISALEISYSHQKGKFTEGSEYNSKLFDKISNPNQPQNHPIT